MDLLNRKNKTSKKIFKLSLLAALLCVFWLAFSGSKALAATCPLDPDYAAAGTTTTVPATGCATTPNYVFTGDSDPSDPNPVIIYTATSSGGTTDNIATLYLVDPTTDPLVWKGTASYDNHPIAVSINQADLDTSATSVTATRADGGPPPVTKTITIPFDATITQFAESQGIQTQQSSTPGCQQGSVISQSTNTCVPADTCATTNTTTTTGSNDSAGCGNTFVSEFIDPAITFLGIGVGVIIVTMVVLGGIQYAASGGDPQAVAAAKKRIANAIIALIAFALMYALLQWLIPGGLFNTTSIIITAVRITL